LLDLWHHRRIFFSERQKLERIGGFRLESLEALDVALAASPFKLQLLCALAVVPKGGVARLVIDRANAIGFAS